MKKYNDTHHQKIEAPSLSVDMSSIPPAEIQQPINQPISNESELQHKRKRSGVLRRRIEMSS